MDTDLSSIHGHVVILGWSARVKRIISELRSDNLERADNLKPILVIAEENEELAQIPFERVYVIYGSHNDPAVLRRANLGQAEALLIPTRLVDTAASDGAGVYAWLNAMNVNPEIHACVEVAEAHHGEVLSLFRNEKVSTGKLEIVSLESVSERLMEQATINPGVTAVYNHLLTFDKTSNEIYAAEVGPAWLGKTFRHLSQECFEQGVIVIGYQSNGEPVLNPKDRGYVWQKADRAWFIAYDKADGLGVINPSTVE